MSGLDNSSAAWGASAGLMGVSLIPLVTFWAFNLSRNGQRPEPVKMAHVFLRIALPVYFVAVALSIVSPSVAAWELSGGIPRPTLDAATIYTALTSTFAVTVASIAVTSAVYLGGLSVWYLVLARQKWWTYLRLDVIGGAVLLLILDIGWLAKNLSQAISDKDVNQLTWLLVIIDAALCLVAAGVVGVAVYAAPKLRRVTLGVGNLSALLLLASLLWLLRCTYLLAIDLMTVLSKWTPNAQAVQMLVYPILDFWVSATVLGLLTFIMRNPVWSEPAANPERRAEQQPQNLVQDPGYYLHPQYGFQQYPSELPPTSVLSTRVYETEGRQWAHELPPTPVPATRVYEADGAQRAAELQGAPTQQPTKHA